MNLTTARRVVFVSALYDLLVTIPFATPWTAAATLSTLTAMHERFGLSGQPPMLGDPTAMLFVNLLGSLVTVWSLVRLHAPTPEHGLADTMGRALFSTWMIYALTHGASTVVVTFLVPEALWGLVQFVVVRPFVWQRGEPWTPKPV